MIGTSWEHLIKDAHQDKQIIHNISAIISSSNETEMNQTLSIPKESSLLLNIMNEALHCWCLSFEGNMMRLCSRNSSMSLERYIFLKRELHQPMQSFKEAFYMVY
jgi:hypothetical protein